ncbi:MAG: HAMP domain-containing protein, partial [Desulfovibrionales bacterium]
MPLKTLWGKDRFISLRTRFFLITSLLLVLVLGGLAGVLSHLQSHSMKEHLEKRGFSIARSLVATSVNNLLTYNYVALEQAANKSAHSPDILYVIIHDKEGKVAGYSGKPELQGEFLTDDLTRSVLQSDQPGSRSGFSDGDPVLETSYPVQIPSSSMRWGVIRVGMSLTPMIRQIRQTQMGIFGLGIVALVLGMGFSVWAAGKVTDPLHHLTEATIQASKGNLDQEILIRSRDEVGILAANFKKMMIDILAHRNQLEKQLEEISTLTRYKENLLTGMAEGLLSFDLEGRVRTLNP